ncbi:class I SAM-dependent DNA methyltransferase [Rhodohalobacter sulfatireducens]|uniref:Class I SAM-dependent methyltransferase n=1 Tax=Rhodohalobacter sulfatireducens TaxID=2911366 RepID=A0ABS9KB92_9BACT|nr:class I SAM-dependent methyltransferase [Rhodohalobacter sulfatireducens]MCG2588098.1 class I SAM-dependent methyltransferase [Rhodohalobacter sulfatireducens]MDR9408926.1 class I SAM-dependent methyltransferase [Balneolaceae bacterium]
MTLTLKEKPTYSVLADIYDIVMADVDYETWADYIDEIILMHQPTARSILELACGTGTIALSLEELDCYEISATDGSPDMIRIARQKAAKANSEINFQTMNFLNLSFERSFDVIYMVFDSLNYLHTKEDIIQLHKEVKNILNPGGIFVYDFTTPRNSRKAIRFLNNESKTIDGEYRYHRESSFNAKERIHTNRFHIEKLDETNGDIIEKFEEQHQQKIYTLDDIQSIIKKTDFEVVQAYDGFELKPAHKKSLRVTMVLK